MTKGYTCVGSVEESKVKNQSGYYTLFGMLNRQKMLDIQLVINVNLDAIDNH